MSHTAVQIETDTQGPVAAINRQRKVALALIVLEATAISVLSHAPAIPIVAVVCALTGVLAKWRIDLTRQRVYDAIALVGLAFVAKYMLLPDNPRYTQLFASQPIALSVGEFVLVLQALVFFVKRPGDRLPFLLPGMGVIALACAAIVEVSLRERTLFQTACVTFAMLAALYCDASRQFVTVRPTRRVGRPIASSVCLAIVGASAWFLASALFHYERHMDLWVRRYLMDDFASPGIRLSNTSTIGSVSLQKSQESNAVALRVSSTAQPDYFRGRAFSEYFSNQWSTEPNFRTLSPSQTRPAVIPAAEHSGRDFEISDATRGEIVRYEVWPAEGLVGTLAAPQITVWLQSDCLDVAVNQHGILQSSTALPGSPYTIHAGNSEVGGAIRAPDDALKRSPAWAVDDPEIVRLAESLFAECRTTTERIAAVTRYFAEYEYSLEVTVPEDLNHDPVAWFLLEKPAAHCEFFASGTVVLLRMAGVPSRYVTGFVFTGKNQFSGEWIARNRDAHAWVEAWDESSQRWITVESTPASGIPQDSAVSDSSQFREYLAHRFQQLRARWRRDGIRMIGHLILSALLSPVGLGLFGTALVVTALVLQRRLRGRERRRGPRRVDASLQPLHTVLQIVDRSVARCFRSRETGETLKSFAAELSRQSQAADADAGLRRAAEWYQCYASLRYASGRTNEQTESLSQDGRELAQQLLRGRRKAAG